MTDEHAHGEQETDDMIDRAMVERELAKLPKFVKPLTPEEIEEMIKRVSREVEALDMMYEDELPSDMPMDDYVAWLDASRLVYGVRMGPRYVR